MSNMRKQNTTSILDFLFLLLMGFIVLYMMSIPKEPIKKHDIDEKAEFIIEVSWDDHSSDDVDTFFVAPTGEKIFFKRPNQGFYNLDRDDQGIGTDKICPTPDDCKVVYINREVITMRGYTEGTYHLNVFMYSKRNVEPANVKVKITKLNPYQIIDEQELVLSNKGDEKTVANFTLDKDGKVVDINYEQISLKQEIGLYGQIEGGNSNQ